MIRHRTKDLKFRLQILRKIHDTRDIATAVAIIRRGPHGNDVLVFEVVLVAFVDKLVCAGDEGEVVDVVELVESLT